MQTPRHKPEPTGTQTRRPARRKRHQSSNTSSPDFVEALARGLQLMRCFEPGVAQLGNLELAERTGLPKSTVSRLVYTLTTLGYLRYHSDTGRYSPDYGVLALGFGYLANLEVRQLAHPLMKSLAQRTGAAVALGTFDGEQMTYVDAVHGSSALYLRLPAGYRVSMHSTMGRAYLAGIPASERDRLVDSLDLPAEFPLILDKACKDYAASACCYGIGDWQPGINAIAAPFQTLSGEGQFVISCGGPEAILPEAYLRDDVTLMMQDVLKRLTHSSLVDTHGNL